MNIDPLQDILEYIKTSLSLESMSEIDSKKRSRYMVFLLIIKIIHQESTKTF